MNPVHAAGSALPGQEIAQAVPMPGEAKLFESRDLDQACEEIGRVYCPHRYVLEGRRTGAASMFNLPGEHTGLSSFTYGADIAIEPEPFQDFVLVLTTVSGKADIRAGAFHCAGGLGTTAAVGPDVAATFRYSAGNTQRVVRLDRRKLEHVWQGMAGPRHATGLTFQSMALQTPTQLGQWTAMLQGLGQVLRPEVPLSLRRMLLPRAEEMLMMSLLWEQAQQQGLGTEGGTGLSGEPVAAVFRRATTFIEAHAGSALTLVEIAAAAKCSVRTLQRVFQQSYGAGVMAYVRAMRLALAHRLLSDAQGPASVTEVAMRCGFAHLGQFAADYRRQFGERPSETLRRRV